MSICPKRAPRRRLRSRIPSTRAAQAHRGTVSALLLCVAATLAGCGGATAPAGPSSTPAAPGGPSSPSSATPATSVAAPASTTCPSGTALPSGTIVTFAGGGTSTGDGIPATDASLAVDSGSIGFDKAGGLLVGDRVRAGVVRIGPDGVLSTYAKPFERPAGLAVGKDGEVYLANGLAAIVRIDPSGARTVVAGTGVGGSSGNEGPAAKAQVNPSQVAIGPAGDLYFDDTNSWRRIDGNGIVHAFAGTGTTGFSGDGGPAAQAQFGESLAIAADRLGNVYLGDDGNNRIRKVDPAGVVTTIAGTGVTGRSGDGGAAAAATLDAPTSITVDDAGNLYFADAGTNTVRRIDPKGIIDTVAGTGTAGASGDCGPATAAELNQPTGLAVRDGALYIVDSENGRIRMVVP